MLNRLKRFLAMTLTVLMFINMLPVDALAATTSSWVGVGNYASTYAISGPTEVTVGKNITLTGSNDWYYSDHSWESSNTAVATVTGDGGSAKVTGVSAGTATITHTYSGYWSSEQTETYTVTVVAAAEIPTFTVKKGETITLTYDYVSSNGNTPSERNPSLTFVDGTVAALDGNISSSGSGNTRTYKFTVLGKKKGETNVTLYRNGSAIYTFKLIVTADPYAEIKSTATLPLYGEEPDPATALGLKVYDADGNLQDAAKYTVAWTSSAEEIVSINNDVLSTIAEGDANVTATVTLNDTALEAVTCAVTVKAVKVNFNVNGTTYPATVKEDGTVEVPSSVSAPDGYAIIGWSATKGGTDAVDLATATFATDTTLYAILQEGYTVTYHTWDFENNTYEAASEIVFGGDEITLPTLTDENGYIAMGWSGTTRSQGVVSYQASLGMFTYAPGNEIPVNRNLNFYSVHRAPGAVFYDEERNAHYSSFDNGAIVAPKSNLLSYNSVGWEHVGWSESSTTVRLEPAANANEFIVTSFEDGKEYSIVLQRRVFTVTFAESINENGEAGDIIATREYAYGAEVGNPSITDESGFVYTVGAHKEGSGYFYGWTPVITSVSGDHIVTPRWGETAIGEGQHVVTFVLGNAVHASVVVDNNTAIGENMPEDPTAGANVAFTGWVKTNGEAFSDSEPIVEDMTLVATFKAGYLVRYIVGDDAETGNVYYSETVAKDSKANAPVDPAKDGYKFMGWREKGTDRDFDFTQTIITRDIDLYARFSDVDYLFYVANGGTENAPFRYVVEEKSAYTTLPTTTRVGYDFDGWYWGDADGNITVDQVKVTTADEIKTALAANANVAADNDLYLVANWKAKLVPVTVVAWDQKSVQDRGASSNTDDTMVIANYNAKATTYTVYAYPGDTISVASGNVLTAKNGVYSSAEKTGSFNLGNIPVTTYFEYQGIGDAQGKSVTVQPSGTVLNVFYKRTHYTLKFNCSYDTDNKFTMYCKSEDKSYSGTEYSITAELDEDIASRWPYYGSDNWKFTCNKTSRIFYGWYTLSGDSTQVSMIRTMTPEICKKCADKSNHTATVDGYTTTAGNAFYLMYAFDTLLHETINATKNKINFTIQDEYTQFANGSQDYYGLKGFSGVKQLDSSSDKNSRTVKTDWSDMGISNYDDYPKSDDKRWPATSSEGSKYYQIMFYKRNTHTITLNMNDLAAVGNEVVRINDYTPEISEAGAGRYGSYTNNGNTSTKSTTYTLSGVRFGEHLNYVVPTNKPTRGTAGQFVFTGWYLDPGCNDPYIGGSMPDSDITLYAGWIVNPVDVSYYYGEEDGSDLFAKDTDIPSGTVAPELDSNPANSLQYGQFEGWYYYPFEGSDYKAEFNPGETVINGNTNVYAKWKTTDFTVTYDSDTGKIWNDPLTYNLRTQLILADIGNITNGDKVFVGWAEEGNENRLRQPGDVYQVYYDVTFTAVWKDPSEVNTVIYHDNYNNPEATHKQYVPKNNNVHVLNNMFNRANYEFLGWNTKADGSGTTYMGSATVAAGIAFPAGKTEFHLYAQWRALNGDLTIKKTVSNLPADMLMDDAFTFTVTKKGEATAADTITLQHNGSKTISLPVGTYIVTESGIKASDGSSAKHTYEMVASQEITITAGGKHEVTFNNVANDKISVSGTKTWPAGETHNNATQVTLTLKRDDAEVEGATPTWVGNTYTFANLPKYNGNGVAHVYTVEESATGYDTQYDSQNPYNITNVPSTIDVTVTKTWQDGGDASHRPGTDAFEVYLADSTNTYTADTTEATWTTSEGGNVWTATITGVRTHDAAGNPITYNVSETAVSEYYVKTGDTTVTPANDTTVAITNTRSESGSVVFTKDWVDATYTTSRRPSFTAFAAMLALTKTDTAGATNAAVDATPAIAVASDNANQWTITYNNLPLYDANGAKITYTLTETLSGDTATWYTATKATATNVGNNNNLTNTLKTINFTVKKIIADGSTDSAAGLAQNFDIKVTASFATTGDTGTNEAVKTLGNNGEEIIIVPVGSAITVEEQNAGNAWDVSYKLGDATAKATFANETVADGAVVTVTNTRKLTSVSATKEWNEGSLADAGYRPANVTVQLKADGTNNGAPVVLSADNDWKNTWQNLPQYTVTGATIAYSVAETKIGDEDVANGQAKGYSVAVSGSAAAGFEVTNTLTLGELTITKKVTGLPTGVTNNDVFTVTVTKADDANIRHTVTLMAGESKTVKNLPEGTYNVVEANGDSWTHTYEKAADTTATVTAGTTAAVTLTNAVKDVKSSITVKKTWNDNGNQDGLRPEKITVKLSSATANYEAELTGGSTANEWTGTISNVRLYTDGENSQNITYTVTEEGVGNAYTQSFSGTFVAATSGTVELTNSHTPETTSVSVTKVWNDGNNVGNIRPESVQVQLYKGSGDSRVAVGDAVTLTEVGNWTHTWSNLPKYAGTTTAIVYTVDEVAVPTGYTKQSVSRADGTNNWTITNKLAQVQRSITVTKNWIEPADYNGRPTSITLKLKRGDEELTDKQVTVAANEAGTWTHTWTGLDKYNLDDMTVYDYTVSEVVPTNYASYTNPSDGKANFGANNTASVGITNVLISSAVKTSVEVTKEWVDDAALGDKSVTANRSEVTFQLRSKVGNQTAFAPVDGKTATFGDLDNTGSTWTHTFTDLEKYAWLDKNGKVTTSVTAVASIAPYAWGVQENSTPSGYTQSGPDDNSADGLKITNTITPNNNKTITVTKEWDVPDYVKADASATFTLKRRVIGSDDATYSDVTFTDGQTNPQTVSLSAFRALTADAKQQISWNNLPLYNEHGYAYSYIVVETAPTGYTATWEYDGDNCGDTYANGKITAAAKTLSAKNVINKDVDITVSKSLTDTKWTALQQTDDFVFELYYVYGNGTEQQVTHTEHSGLDDNDRFTVKGDQSVTLSGLASGQYKVKEVLGSAAAAWTSVVPTAAVGDNGSITVTNTRKVTSVTATKEWNDVYDTLRPNVTFTLYYTVDGVKKALDSKSSSDFTTVDRDTETYTWNDLPTHTVDGKVITWTVEESMTDLKASYTASEADKTADADNRYILTNSASNTVSVSATKAWDLNGIVLTQYPTVTMGVFYGTSADTAVQLTKWDSATSKYVNVETTLTGGATDVSFSNLPVLATGYNYYIKETGMTGNVKFVSGGVEQSMAATDFFDYTTNNKIVANGGTITNAARFGAFEITKTVDFNDTAWPAGASLAFSFGGTWVSGGVVKAASLTITPDTEKVAKSSGQMVAPLNRAITITETTRDGWTASKTSESITITGDETTVPVASFTNTRKTTSADVQKVFSDSNNKYGLRPTATFKLTATATRNGATVNVDGSGAIVENSVVIDSTTLSADGSYSFKSNNTTKLPAYTADDLAISYSVAEEMSSSDLVYSKTEEDTTNGVKFTNSITENQSITVTKKWALNGVELSTYPIATFGVYYGTNDADLKELKINGAHVTASTTGVKSDEDVTFTDLPVLASGYNYYIKETGLTGGTLVYDGTNTATAATFFDFVTNDSKFTAAVVGGKAEITNTIAGYRAYTITKEIDLNGTKWTGAAHTFSFTADAVDSNGVAAVATVTLTPGLTTRTATSGQIVVQKSDTTVSVEERADNGWNVVGGNTKTVAADASGVTFKNVRATTTLSGTKTWHVNGTAPTTISVVVKRVNGTTQAAETFTETYDIAADGSFSANTITIGGEKYNVPTHSEAGEAYNYTIDSEVALNGYVIDRNGNDFTNTQNAKLIVAKAAREGDTTAFGFSVAATDAAYILNKPEDTTVAFGAQDEYTVKGEQSYTVTETPTSGYYLTGISVNGVDKTEDQTNATTGAVNPTISTGKIAAGTTATVTYTNAPQLGSFTITKKGADGVLAGAQFTLYKYENSVKGDVVATATTDANGKITFSDLPIGSYYVEETAAADGYEISAKAYATITVTGNTNNVKAATVAIQAADATTATQTNDVEFTNTLVGGTSFTLKKLVNEGNFDNTTSEFDFKVTLSNTKHLNYTVSFGGKQYSTTNGNLEINSTETGNEALKLAQNETAVISGMPLDTTISVVELGVNSDVWTTTYSASSVTITSESKSAEITVTNTRNTANLTATKTWNDQDNHFALRPATIELKLQRNGSVIDTQPVNVASGNANTQALYTWNNLAKYDENGVAYSYTVVETAVNRYNAPTYAAGTTAGNSVTLTDGNKTITITNTLNTAAISITKNWDENGLDVDTGVLTDVVKAGRPNLSFTLTNSELSGLSETARLASASDKDSYNVSFARQMPVSGSYALSEAQSGGAGFTYTTNIVRTPAEGNTTGFTVTNTLKKMNITLTKNWIDNDITVSQHPTATFELYYEANGADVVVKTESSNGTSISFNNVPYRTDYKIRETALSGDTAYLYTVNSTPVNVTLGNDGNGTATITNKSTYGMLELKKTVKLNGTKWDRDADPTFTFNYSYEGMPMGENNTRSITVDLDEFQTADETATCTQQIIVPLGKEVTVTEVLTGDLAKEWTVQTGTQKITINNTNGTTKVDKQTLTFTNTRNILDGGLTVTKNWNDKGGDPARRPDSVTFTLYYNEKGTDGKYIQVPTTVVAQNPITIERATGTTVQSGTFTNVPVNASGYVVVETINGTNAGAYVVQGSDTVTLTYDQKAASFTNYPTKAVVTLTKTVVDNTIESAAATAKFDFAAESATTGSAIKTATVDSIGNGESATFEVVIGETYTITETNDNTTAIDADTWTVAYTGATDTTTNGVATFTATQAVHTIGVTNTRVDTTVPMQKIWVDNSNAEGTRPDSITVVLERKGTDGAYAAVKSGEADVTNTIALAATLNPYTFSAFNGKTLPKADLAGNVYDYRLNEVTTDGVIAGKNSATYTCGTPVYNSISEKWEITNTLNAGATTKTFTKVWVDGNDEQGIRPTAEAFKAWLTLYRKAAGVNTNWESVTATPDVTASGNTYTITYSGLARFDAQGRLYTYALEEDYPANTAAILRDYKQSGATVHLDGDDTADAVAENGTITNTLAGETVDVSLTKSWVDGDGKTLENITEDQLYTGIIRHINISGQKQADEFVKGVVLTKTDNWTATENGLSKYDANGALYVYGAVEYANETDYASKNAVVNGATVAFSNKNYTVTYGASSLNNLTITNVRGDDGATDPTKTFKEEILHIYTDGKKVDVNDSWTYTITWNNNTNQKQTVTITDDLASYLSIESIGNATCGCGKAECGHITDASKGSTGNTVTWRFKAAPFTSGSVSVTVKLNSLPTEVNGKLVAGNKATVAIGNSTGVEAVADDIPVSNPNFTVDKAVTTTVDGEVKTSGYKLGETVNYQITVTNTGNLTLNNLKVEDVRDKVNATSVNENTTSTVPGTDMSASTPANWNGATGTIASLAPGASIVLSYSHVITEDDIENGGIRNVVTVTTDDPTSDTDPKAELTRTDTKTITTVSADAELTLVKEVATKDESGKAKLSGYKLGEEISYSVTLTNTGNLTVNNVVFTDDHIADYNSVTVTGATGNVTATGINVGDMTPGQAITFTYSYKVVEGDIWATKVTNKAEAAGTYNGTAVAASDTKTVATDAVTPAIDVTKTIVDNRQLSDDYYTEGETVNFTMVVKNTGNVSLKNVTVTDAQFAAADLTIVDGENDGYHLATNDNVAVLDANLVPGASVTLTARYTVQLDDLGNKRLTNTAVAKGTAKNSAQEVSDSASATFTTDELTSYTVTKVWNDAGSTEVRPANVTVELKRNGTKYHSAVISEDGAVITNHLNTPAEAAVTVTDNGSKWGVTFTKLPKHNTAHEEFSYTVAETKIGTLAVTNGAAHGYNVKVEGSTITNSIDPIDLTVTKQWQDGEGKALLYTKDVPSTLNIALANDKNVAIGTANKTMTKAVEGETAFATWTYTFQDVPQYDANGNQLTYTVTETLPTGFTATSTSATFANGAAELVNTKKDEAPIDPVKAMDSSTPTIKVGNEEMAIDQQTITYTIAWSNNYATTKEITITDTLPVGLSHFSSNPEATVNGSVLSWEIDAKPFEDGVITVTATVDRDAIIANAAAEGKYDPTVTNQAQMIVTGDDVTRESNGVETSIYNPLVSIAKVVTSTPVNPNGYQLGETITYEITVTNAGNVPLKNVKVTDELTGDEWTVNLAVNGSETFTVNADNKAISHTVTAADVAAYAVTNTAKVVATPDAVNADGQPMANITATDAIVTVPTYKASGNWKPENVVKTLEGANLIAGAYKFVVTDATGKVVSTGTNGADGSVTFSDISYTLDDLTDTKDATEYTYTIREVTPANAETYQAAFGGTLTFDDTVNYCNDSYTVTVTVSDNNVNKAGEENDRSLNAEVTSANKNDTFTIDNYKKIDAEVSKTWQQNDLVDIPDIKITLYRKAEGVAPEKAADLDDTWTKVGEQTLTSGKTSVVWTNIDRVDADGKAYTYVAVETLDDYSAASYNASADIVELTETATNKFTGGFTNTRKLGSGEANNLSVSKTVVNGEGKDLTNEMRADTFDFIVKVPADLTVGATISYTLNGAGKTATVGNDVTYGRHFKLEGVQHGQTATVTTQLPTGAYEVIELQKDDNTYDYTVSYGTAGNSQALAEGGTVAFAATNTTLADGFMLTKLWQQPNGEGNSTKAFDYDEEFDTASFGLYFADGKPVQQNGKALVVEADENGIVTFTDIATTLASGANASYYVQEIAEETGNYVVSDQKIEVAWNGTKFEVDQPTVINELKTYDLTIEKSIDWNGTADRNVSFTIDFSYSLPGATDATTGTVTAAWDAEADVMSYTTTIGSATADGNVLTLPYGTEVTVDETPNDAWTKAITGLDAGKAYATVKGAQTVTVTNTRKLTTLDFTKVWVDNSNEMKARPEQIVVVAQRLNGEDYEVVVDELTGETYTETLTVSTETDSESYKDLFGDEGVELPKYAVDGDTCTEYSYRVAEQNEVIAGVDQIADYTSEVDGDTVTNTIKQETVTVAGEKSWTLIEGEDAPEITIRLYRDGLEIDSRKVVTKAGETTASYEFTGLEKYAVGEIEGYNGEYDGHLFVYTVSEDEVNGYTTDQDGNDFANTAIETTVQLTKTWVDGDGKALDEALIPEALDVELLRNDVVYRSVTLSAEANRTAESVWSYSFTGLPTHDAKGAAYTYTVRETLPNGFTAQDNATTVAVVNGAAQLVNTKDTINPVKPEKEAGQPSVIYIEGTTEQAKVGAEITYTITYTNNLNTAATVTIEDIIPAGTEYVASTNGGAYADGKVTWTLTEVAPFTSGMVQVTVRVTEEALEGAQPDPQVSNTASVKIGNNASVEAVADDIPVYNPVLTLDKEEISTPEDGEVYRLGEVIEYRITLKNEGNVTLTDILVTDSRIAADQMTFTAEEGITFENGVINTMAPGDVVVLDYSVEVTEALILESGDTVINSAKAETVDPDDPDLPIDPEDEVEVDVDEPNGHLTITKNTTSTPADGEAYVLGEEIEYEIIVENDGNLTITDITVTDELTGDEWTIASLAPQKSETFTASYIVTEADLFNDTVKNVATAKGVSPDPEVPDVPVEPGNTEDPTEEPKPAYTVVKEAANEPANGEFYELGETAKFTITVTNTGNLTLNNIVVKEELEGAIFADGKTEASIGTLKPGQTVVLNAEYTIVESDLGNEALANTLSAKASTVTPDEPEQPVDPDPIKPAPIPVDDVKTVAVEKVWNDADNAFATRETITVDLLADGVVYRTAEISADADGEWNYSFEQLPAHKDGEVITYTVNEHAITGYDTAYEQVEGGWKITNNLQQYTLTIRYWYDSVGGDAAAATFNRSYYYGESYNVASPAITGHSVDRSRISGVITGDAEYDVVYTPINYRLTINYVYEDGTTAARSYRGILNYDIYYSIGSPALEGYVASTMRVSGRMPARDTTYTVIYVPETTIIDEYGVPLNIGSVVMNVGDCFE